MSAEERGRLLGAALLVVGTWLVASRWSRLRTRRRRAISDFRAVVSTVRHLVRDIVGLTASMAGMLLVGALLVAALVAGCVARH